MYQPPSRSTLAWVAGQVGRGGTVSSCDRLVGGSTSDVDRIVVHAPNGTDHRFVLRRWTNDEAWTDGLVEREGAGLLALAGQVIGAPELVAGDPTGDAASVRCLLMTERPGVVQLAATDLDAWLDQLASTQARIHDVPATLSARADGWFDPHADFDWLDDPGLRREAIAAASALPSGEPDVFAHGDYQHFNVLWTGERLTGVIDWAMVGTGPRGLDVGHCRLNLAVLFSPAAAEEYLRRYEQASEVIVDPHADLRGLLGWDSGWPELIPNQVAARKTVGSDLGAAAMAGRVTATIRLAVDRLG